MMAFVAGLAFLPTFFTPASANQTKNVYLQDQLTYVKVDVKELPEELVIAIAKDYAQTVIKSAAVTDIITGEKVYKLSLENSEGEGSVIYCYSDGAKYSE